MPAALRKALHRPLPGRSRTAGLVALLPLAAAVVAATPAQAATVTCQAVSINPATIAGGNSPSGACTNQVNPGDTFEIDFSKVFQDNGGSLETNKFYSLQIANLNTGSADTLSFSDVELLISGATGPSGVPPSTNFNNQAITIWQTNEGANSFTPVFPLAQGVTDYTTNASTNSFGGNPVSSMASFKLTGPNANVGLGAAGLINTFPVDLAAAGITSFTGAKIRGTFNGSTNGVRAFSAGLAVFTPTDPMAMSGFPGGAPDIIYGNAFNTVPGPLPIVGAGAAFGWSRRLRRRVAAAKAV